MFKKLINHYNTNIKDNKGGLIPLLGVALIIFILTMAIHYVAVYVTADYSNANMVSNWDYGYTERVGKVPDAELRVFNQQNPLITEKAVKRSNLYLVKTFEPSDKKRTLVVNTDHSPVMIKVNGREVYNNQYKSAEYVGNCYNAVVLDGTSREQVVEIFMKLPFSVRFNAAMTKQENPAVAFSLRFFIGAIFVLLGLSASVFFAIYSIRKKKLFRTLALALFFMFVGIIVMAQELTEITYIFNAPYMMNIITAISNLTYIFGQFCIVGWLKRRKNMVVAVSFAAAVSEAALLLAVTPAFFGIAVCASAVIQTASAVYICVNAGGYVSKRTQYAIPVFVISAYYSMINLIGGVFLFTRNTPMNTFTLSIPSLIIIGTLGYVFYSDYKYKKKNAELRNQSRQFSESVNNISHFIHNMLSCRSEDKFYETAAREVCSLLEKYRGDYSDVKYCIGVKSDDGYIEVINNEVDGCNYDIIEEYAIETGKGCMFADTYFDFALKKSDNISALLHFENISNGLDMFFDSMIETAYCGLETAFEKTCDSLNSREIDIIFGELALNTEIDNGYTPDHLEHIAKYSYELCKKLGMSEEEAELISTASKLHDIGKIAIPKNIINKESRLTEEEQIIVASHSKFGYLILSAYDDDPFLATAAEIACYHHERYDGTGYNGLKGEDIPLCARIITICDVFDALVSERSYKKAWSVSRALNYLDENSGTIFDPKLLELFKECVNETE